MAIEAAAAAARCWSSPIIDDIVTLFSLVSLWRRWLWWWWWSAVAEVVEMVDATIIPVVVVLVEQSAWSTISDAVTDADASCWLVHVVVSFPAPLIECTDNIIGVVRPVSIMGTLPAPAEFETETVSTQATVASSSLFCRFLPESCLEWDCCFCWITELCCCCCFIGDDDDPDPDPSPPSRDDDSISQTIFLFSLRYRILLQIFLRSNQSWSFSPLTYFWL